MVRITLPSLIYKDPLPLLLFDKVLIDRSIFSAFDSGDEFELKLLEELEKRGIAQIDNLCDESTLEKRCYKIFADFSLQEHGIKLFSPKTAIEDIDKEEFYAALHKAKRADMDLSAAFTILKECYLSLQVTRDHKIPMIRSEPFYLGLTAYILSTDKRRNIHKAISPQGLAFESLKHSFDFYGPTLPLMTTKDGKPINPIPVFLRLVGFVKEGEEDKKLDEVRSWENFEKLLEMRKSPLVSDFRKYIIQISNRCSQQFNIKDIHKELIAEHKKRLSQLQYAIAQEYRWIERFAKISGYLSIPLGLAGFGYPPFGVASAALAISSALVDATHHRLIKKREKDHHFYEQYPDFRWRLFLADLEAIYRRNDFLQLMRRMSS